MKPITYELWSDALSLTESNNVDNAIGDAGRALGRWQMHPDFVDNYWPPDTIQVGMTWKGLFNLVLVTFFVREGGTATIEEPQAIKLAMKFHLGVTAYKRGDQDAQYQARFTAFLQELCDDA